MTLDSYQKNQNLEKAKAEKRKKLTMQVVGATLVLVGIIYAYKKFSK